MFSRRSAIYLVIIMGLVSLCADITYEGARSITGQYLAVLGASGVIVGSVAGLGEFIGYGFRLVSGYVSDRSQRYWLMTFTGYCINMFAVPLLALAESWPAAAALILAERFGKAIRTPARDALLSYATHSVGRGWGFGLHEALDQVGAIVGPLAMGAVLLLGGGYRMGFALLLIPALAALCFLMTAKLYYPRPQDLEIENPALRGRKFKSAYWYYIGAVTCIGAGYIDFPLLAYHFQKSGALSDNWVPAFYAIAMAADGVAALIFGRLFDKKGIIVVAIAAGLSLFFVPFVYLGGFYSALMGMILWGIGLGAQESVMRAVVATVVPMGSRATAYGVMNIWFGGGWFLGSTLIGYLYDVSLFAMMAFSMLMQLAAIPLFFIVKRKAHL